MTGRIMEKPLQVLIIIDACDDIASEFWNTLALRSVGTVSCYLLLGNATDFMKGFLREMSVSSSRF